MSHRIERCTGGRDGEVTAQKTDHAEDHQHRCGLQEGGCVGTP